MVMEVPSHLEDSMVVLFHLGVFTTAQHHLDFTEVP
jgi:hypothetical protein